MLQIYSPATWQTLLVKKLLSFGSGKYSSFISLIDDLYLLFSLVSLLEILLFKCWFAHLSSYFLVFSHIYLYCLLYFLCLQPYWLSSLFCFLNPLVLVELFVCFITNKYLFEDVSNSCSFTKFLSMHSIYFLQDAFY